ncbi:MAG: succinyldiaminopimelate transaminase [Burkholderiaceae bacterium]
MNPKLALLKPYPFERYRELLEGIEPPAHQSALDLSIGEPKHPTPECVRAALLESLDGLSVYPATAGTPRLREAIGRWLERRYGLSGIDPLRDLLPVLGSREALFAATQVLIDPTRPATVICPNPFYQIYEGAALLAGAQTHYVPLTPGAATTAAWHEVSDDVWARTQLLFICSPGNPTGDICELDEWKYLFAQSDKYGFFIFSDECYSEIYREALPSAPLGALQAARKLGRGHERLLVFGSLSKRSNVPGMRSGYVAGDRELIGRFLKFRTYHGSAMSPPYQAASCAAWQDEAHVAANRALYDAKYSAVTDILGPALSVRTPPAGFYLWVRVPGGDDTAFARELMRQYNVRVLPGSYLGREVAGSNPGAGHLRIALVDTLDRCVEASHRIARLSEILHRL